MPRDHVRISATRIRDRLVHRLVFAHYTTQPEHAARAREPRPASRGKGSSAGRLGHQRDQ